MPAYANAAEVTVAVAANFRPALEQLQTAFEAQSSHTLTITSGSTGLLYAQIKNGAPFDIFLAADQARPALLHQQGLTQDAPKTYAVGQLILWQPPGSGNRLGATGVKQHLNKGDFHHLAIANPKLAPYGVAAQQVLQNLELGHAFKNKLVFGENVAQTFAFIYTGHAEMGFIALAQHIALPQNQRGDVWTPSEDIYDPIKQDMALLLRAKDNEAADALMHFLQSPQAQQIITQSGYKLP